MKKENKVTRFASWLLAIGCIVGLACLFSLNISDRHHQEEFKYEDDEDNTKNKIYKDVVRVSSDNIKSLDFDSLRNDKCPVLVRVSSGLIADSDVINVIDELKKNDILVSGLYFETSVLEDLDYVLRNDVSYVDWKSTFDLEYSFAKDFSKDLGYSNLYLDLVGSNMGVVKEITKSIDVDKILSSDDLPYMSSVNESEDSYIIKSITRKR